MAKIPPFAGTALGFCGLALLLAGCAAPANPPPIAENTAPPQGNIIAGVLVAIRPASQTMLAPSSAAVLAALRQPPAAQAPNATEFVVQRSDGDIASIVLASPAASPDASMSAGDFSLGDQVELVTGEQTVLIHRTP